MIARMRGRTARMMLMMMMMGEEDEEEEGDYDPDLPATLGFLSGTRLEVRVMLIQRCDKRSRRWWPVTLGRRAKRSTDADGRQLYRITYDASPELGINEEIRAKASFIDGVLLHEECRGKMSWRLMEAPVSESDSSDEDGSESEDEEYDVDDLTDDMAGLGGGVLGGPRLPRKRALIVACSYPGSSAPLPGTLNDADEIFDLLVNKFDFPNTTDSIMMLRDDDDNVLLHPTKRNIRKGFSWLLSDLKPGDSLFLYFSGHGSTVDDPTGREWRGNQTICPCDYEQCGVITDTEIYKALVKPLPQSTTLHALIDSCHSGTVMNLPYNAVLDGGRFSIWHEEYPGESGTRGTAGGLAVQFSAAGHDQTASEAPIGHGKRCAGKKREGQSRGAATYAFTQAILQHREIWGSDILYSDLLEKMSDELRKSKFYDQDPQMSCTQQLDLNRHDIKITL
ncbi:hypothetical protein ABPG77_007854 [Micractinium sp. CCAP 211/92]